MGKFDGAGRVVTDAERHAWSSAGGKKRAMLLSQDYRKRIARMGGHAAAAAKRKRRKEALRRDRDEDAVRVLVGRVGAKLLRKAEKRRLRAVAKLKREAKRAEREAKAKLKADTLPPVETSTGQDAPSQPSSEHREV